MEEKMERGRKEKKKWWRRMRRKEEEEEEEEKKNGGRKKKKKKERSLPCLEGRRSLAGSLDRKRERGSRRLGGLLREKCRGMRRGRFWERYEGLGGDLSNNSFYPSEAPTWISEIENVTTLSRTNLFLDIGRLNMEVIPIRKK
ncbi:hypothetical protein M5K25_011602 [Dendrobium thyrsiflorum]|uniref:Uncharacterized protein n=1 Tax=Dendrobium thyrsiflorum TaxID=117978 RepID=A0ABD0V404_DENTH